MAAGTIMRHALVVLGMHRSGTSALAGMLARLGADLPARQMVPTPDNPKGYYESDPIRLLNDRILASAGSSWDDWTRIPDGWFAGPRAAAFREEARALLAAEFGTSPVFVFKDPRICRLWPFWRDVLAAERIVPLPIITSRHPLEIADSLSRRYGMAPSLARLIGLRHQLDAEHATRGSLRVFASYDEVLSDWRALASRIEAAAGFTMPRRSPLSEAEVDDFLASGLRHYSHDISDLERHSGLPAFLVKAEHAMARLARGNEAGTARELDAIEAELAALAPLFHDIGVQAQTRSRELARQRTEHEALAAERDALASRIAELAEERKTLNARAEALAGERDAANGRAAESKAARDAVVADLAQRIRELAQLTRLTAERETQFAAQAQANLKDQENRILTEIFSSRSWKLTAPLRGINTLYRRLRGS